MAVLLTGTTIGGQVAIHAGNISTYAPSLTGTGATGTWGINITGNAANVTGTVAIANGGTGATTAAGARTNLGASTAGANLFTITNPSAVTFLRINADNTVSALDAATFRTAIGAGTSSTTGTVTSITAGTGLSGGTITTSGTISLANTTVTAGTYTLATITVDAQGRITSASSGTAGGTGTVTSVAVSGGTTGLTVTGSPITTSGTITLAGTLVVANGGTGATTAAGARTNLGLVIGTDVQAYDADLAAIAALAGTSGFLKKTAANTWTLDTNTYLTGNQTITLSGDATGSGSTAIAVTLANSGVTAGTYNNSATAITPIIVDAKGRVTATGAAVTITPAWSSITSKPTTISGFGITDAITTSNISSQSVNFSNYTGYVDVFDTRAVASTPQSYDKRVRFDFKQNSINGLTDGGTYNGVMFWRKYGSSTDWTGGGAMEIAYSDNGNLWHRYGTSTTWGAWRRVWNGNDFSSTDISNWTAAYNDKINSAAVTGTTTKTLTLTQQDAGTVTASWTDKDTTYTIAAEEISPGNLVELTLRDSNATIPGLVNFIGTGATTVTSDQNNNVYINTTAGTSYSAGAGLTLTGNTFSHTDTSAQASVDNANGNMIQDITLDTYGHVTGIGSVDLDTRYYTQRTIDEQITPSLRGGYSLTGGGTISVTSNGFIKWSTRFIVISNGRGSSFTTNGYFDITCPTTGTITGVGGAASRAANSDGIQLNTWEALYYILPVGSINTSVAANFRVVYYSADLTVPHTWIPICVRNGDNGVFSFPRGVNLIANSSAVSYQTETNVANSTVQRDSLGNFSAGTITAALSGNATTATTLQTARTINGVSFNGSANITVTANTTNSITFNDLGVGVLPGTSFNGATARVVSYNTVGAAPTIHYHDQYVEKYIDNDAGDTFVLRPSNPGNSFLGTPDYFFRETHTQALFTYGYHESGLKTENIGLHETGTVVVWKNGKLTPCESTADHMVMGVISNGHDSPVVMGAEPVLVTGPVNEGDYLLTSEKLGHAIAMNREEVKRLGLMDVVFAKALESGEGDSHKVKAMINKL